MIHICSLGAHLQFTVRGVFLGNRGPPTKPSAIWWFLSRRKRLSRQAPDSLNDKQTLTYIQFSNVKHLPDFQHATHVDGERLGEWRQVPSGHYYLGSLLLVITFGVRLV